MPKSSQLRFTLTFICNWHNFYNKYSPNWHSFPWCPSEQIQLPSILSQTSFVVPLELQLQTVMIWLSCHNVNLLNMFSFNFLANFYLPLQKSPKNPSLHWPHFPVVFSHTFPSRLLSQWHCDSQKSPKNPGLHWPHWPVVTLHTFPSKLLWHWHSVNIFIC